MIISGRAGENSMIDDILWLVNRMLVGDANSCMPGEGVSLSGVHTSATSIAKFNDWFSFKSTVPAC